ncbi:MAG: hypothetical protein ACLTDV_12920 [Eubacterium sp.]
MFIIDMTRKKPVSMRLLAVMRLQKKMAKSIWKSKPRRDLMSLLGVNYFDTNIFTAAVKKPWERFLRKITAGAIYIADKLPHYLIKSAAGLEKTFQEQLRSYGRIILIFT